MRGYLRALLVTMMVPLLIRVFLGLAGFLQLRSVSVGWGEAIRAAAGAPINLALAQAASVGVIFIVFFPHKGRGESFLEAVHNHASSEPTYWHCHAGLNRSGLALAAYLHRHRGLRISDAISQLRQKRTRMVLCNSLFERTLRRWYGDPDEQDFDTFSIDDYLVEREGRRNQR